MTFISFRLFRRLKALELLLLTAVFSAPALAGSSAVILQYHHVHTDTPASTSVKPAQFISHLQWLKDNHFQILPLETVVKTLQSKKKFTNDKVVAITFDDANISVCDTAWPILKKHKIPFTLFINTKPIEDGYTSQCSWAQLKLMTDSGLMTPANHSHSHLNMLSTYKTKKRSTWALEITQELELAQKLIVKNLNSTGALFAYPYGEYNADLTKIVSKLGYFGFGQQSGAIGFDSDFSALPRIPASGVYAELKTLSVKLLSLPFPANATFSSENPLSQDSELNPPFLSLQSTDKKLLDSTQCFNGKGYSLQMEHKGNALNVQQVDKLGLGRHRYTCTSKSQEQGRYYWFSHQWLVD